MSNAIKPEHYNRLNPQPKDVIRAWGLNFNLGSAVKYISRAGHKDDIVQDLKKAQEFIQFEIDAIEGARAERKDKPKHEDFMDAMLRGLFGGSVGHIEITGKRNGKTDEEIAEIVDKTIKDIISGMAGVELEEIKEGNGYTEVHITGNANPIEVREYIERELTSNSGKKEQFRVGDVVDINYRKPFDPRGVGYNGDAGLTGRIADIKDAVIYVDAGTLFHSNIVAITLDTVLYVAKAEHEHIEDMRRA